MNVPRALLAAQLVALAAAGTFACAELAGFELVSVAAPDGGDAGFAIDGGDAGDAVDAAPVVLQCLWVWTPPTPAGSFGSVGLTVVSAGTVWIGGDYGAGAPPELEPKQDLPAATGAGAVNGFVAQLDYHAGPVQWSEGLGTADGGVHVVGPLAAAGSTVWVSGQTPRGAAPVPGDAICGARLPVDAGADATDYLAWFGSAGGCQGDHAATGTTVAMVGDNQSQLWELELEDAGMSLYARYPSTTATMDRSTSTAAAAAIPYTLAARSGGIFAGGQFTGTLGESPGPRLTSTTDAYDAFVLGYAFSQGNITLQWASRFPTALGLSTPVTQATTGLAVLIDPDAGTEVFAALPFAGAGQALPGQISTLANYAIALERLDGADGGMEKIAAPFVSGASSTQQVVALRADPRSGRLLLAGNVAGVLETGAGTIQGGEYGVGFLAVLSPDSGGPRHPGGRRRERHRAPPERHVRGPHGDRNVRVRAGLLRRRSHPRPRVHAAQGAVVGIHLRGPAHPPVVSTSRGNHLRRHAPRRHARLLSRRPCGRRRAPRPRGPWLPGRREHLPAPDPRAGSRRLSGRVPDAARLCAEHPRP